MPPPILARLDRTAPLDAPRDLHPPMGGVLGFAPSTPPRPAVRKDPGRIVATIQIKPPLERELELKVTITRSTGRVVVGLDGVYGGIADWDGGMFLNVVPFDMSKGTEVCVRSALTTLEAPIRSAFEEPLPATPPPPPPGAPPVNAGPPGLRKKKKKKKGPALTPPKPKPPPSPSDAAAAARGIHHEALGLVLVRAASADLPWITEVRKATTSEDQSGIDIVVETADIGALFVQVKSSAHGAATWRRKHKNSSIFRRTVLIIYALNHPSTQLDAVRAELVSIRAWVVLTNSITPSAVSAARTAAPAPIADSRQAWRDAAFDLLIFIWPQRDTPEVAELIASVIRRTGLAIDSAAIAAAIAAREPRMLTSTDAVLTS